VALKNKQTNNENGSSNNKQAQHVDQMTDNE